MTHTRKQKSTQKKPLLALAWIWVFTEPREREKNTIVSARQATPPVRVGQSWEKKKDVSERRKKGGQRSSSTHSTVESESSVY
jgi:hypothetical protein